MKKIFTLIISALLTSSSFSQMTEAPQFEIVGDYYGNNYSVLYPIGWSDAGHFAYVSQTVNGLGGAAFYNYELAITDPIGWGKVFEESTTYNLETDTTFWNSQNDNFGIGDTTWFSYEIFKDLYWELHKEEINKLIKMYGIKTSKPNVLEPISSFEKYGASLNIEKKTDTVDVIRVDSEFEANISFKGGTKKIWSIVNQINEDGWAHTSWGYPIDLLYYTIEGFIKMPGSDQFLLYIHENTMGFEEVAEKVHIIPFNLAI